MLTYTFLAVVQVHGCQSIQDANLKFADKMANVDGVTLRSGWACSSDESTEFAMQRASVVLGQTVEGE